MRAPECGPTIIEQILLGEIPTLEKSVEENFKRIMEVQSSVDTCAKSIDAQSWFSL